jgi:WhiB family transcriptional regulator, redox-sensing transcriptional regulator
VTADRSGTGRLGNLVLPPGVEVGWQQHAACKDAPDPDVYFPGKGEDAEAAKEVCAGCPVLGECLAFALATMRAADRDHGVYGGLTPTERARLRGGPIPIRAPRLDSQVQAVIGHRLANRIGLDSAARTLGVTPEALTDAWQRRGRLSPPSQPSRQPSVDERLYQDRAWAKQALALAGQLGIRRAAFVLGVTHGVLYRAWQHHGLDRPTHQSRQRPGTPLRAAAGPPADGRRRGRGGNGREEVGDRDRR